jgi:hypothetical protein
MNIATVTSNGNKIASIWRRIKDWFSEPILHHRTIFLEAASMIRSTILLCTTTTPLAKPFVLCFNNASVHQKPPSQQLHRHLHRLYRQRN